MALKLVDSPRVRSRQELLSELRVRDEQIERLTKDLVYLEKRVRHLERRLTN